MTRPMSFFAAVLLALPGTLAFAEPAQDAAALLKTVQKAYQTHQPGQPYLAAAAAPLKKLVCKSDKKACAALVKTLIKARDTQEGCSRPCAAKADIAIYRAKIELVCEDLGLKADGRGKAVDNYIPRKVPRKKPEGPETVRVGPEFDAEAVNKLLADSRLDPGLRKVLGLKAERLAKALGSLKLIDGKGASAVRADVAAGKKAKVVTQKKRPRKKPSITPIPLSQVETRFVSALNSHISQYPTGRAVLKAVGKIPPVSFRKVDQDTLAYYESYDKELVFNTERLGGAILKLDPGSKGLDLTEPKVLRQYLARNPQVIDGLAGQLDVLYVHELTHVGQHRITGEGFIDRTIGGWKRILNGMKYPIEHEWEAFGNQNKYFGERAEAEPEVLDFKNGHTFGLFEYQDYVRDLQAYRRQLAANYQNDCDTIDKLWFFKSEKAYYDKALAKEAKAWPQAAYKGNLALAKHWGQFRYPMMGIDYLESAQGLAAKHGFADKKKPEMIVLFREMVGKLEKLFTDRESGKPAPRIGGARGKTLRELSSKLGVTLPPNVAAAVKE